MIMICCHESRIRVKVIQKLYVNKIKSCAWILLDYVKWLNIHYNNDKS